VTVPRAHYPRVIQRLIEFGKQRGGSDTKRRLHSFLSYRCARDFLAAFIVAQPEFVAGLHVGAYLTVVSDVDVLARLTEFKLLSQEERGRVVSSVRQIAIETPDAGFLSERLRGLLTDAERKSILDEIEASVIPNLDEVVETEQSNYSKEDDPSEHFSSLKGELRDFRVALENRPAAVKAIDAALTGIDDLIIEMQGERGSGWDPDDDDDRRHTSERPSESADRSVFDDIDD
jgi:hypothetical protein